MQGEKVSDSTNYFNAPEIEKVQVLNGNALVEGKTNGSRVPAKGFVHMGLITMPGGGPSQTSRWA